MKIIKIVISLLICTTLAFFGSLLIADLFTANNLPPERISNADGVKFFLIVFASFPVQMVIYLLTIAPLIYKLLTRIHHARTLRKHGR